MGKFNGRVALITGGARGQGRSHALALAREGADIVICDIARQLESIPYPLSTEEDLKETVRLVEELGRRCVAVKADVRDSKQIQAVVDRAMSEFGRIDILLANAGVYSIVPVTEMTDQMWAETLETDLTGVFNAIRAVLPQMIRQNYGRIVATSSMAARGGWAGLAHYCAAKWGVIGFVKSVAVEAAGNGITVNAICPCTVDTDMVQNDAMYRMFCPDIPNPTKEDAAQSFMNGLNVIPVPWIQPEDITNAVLFFVSEEARYITGDVLHVAAGQNCKNGC